MPSELIPANTPLFHSSSLEYFCVGLNKVVPRAQAMQCLVVRDTDSDRNRFTGQSLSAAIPGVGGVYCCLQNEALLAEVLHYSRTNDRISRDGGDGFPKIAEALSEKFILKIRTRRVLNTADLSPHNPGMKNFVSAVERSEIVQKTMRLGRIPERPLWDLLFHGEDASVARGFGLAVANSGIFHALKASTVRPLPGDSAPINDNLVLFGTVGRCVPGLWIESVLYCPAVGDMQRYEVSF